MKLNNANDYMFVMPDADAFPGGAHEFTGAIMPLRTGAAKNILSYEDICFLQEACGEIHSAYRYFASSLPNNSSFPYGRYTNNGTVDDLKVPRILYGAAVGRYGPRLTDGSTTGLLMNPLFHGSPYFGFHNPTGARWKKFLDAVGTDAGKLFTGGMAYEPRGGRSLSDLSSYSIDMYSVGAGMGIGSPSSGVLFDVFYTLLIYAGSLSTIRALAEEGAPSNASPWSFGAYWAAYYPKTVPSAFTYTYARFYEELAFHDGYSFGLLGVPAVSGTGNGNVTCIFVNSSTSLPTGTGAVLVRTGQIADAHESSPTMGGTSLVAGSTTATSAELSAEDTTETTIRSSEFKNMALGYAILEGALGGSISRFNTSLSLGIDITALAESDVLSPEMVDAAFGLIGLCSRLFIPRFSPYNQVSSSRYYITSGTRATEDVWDGSTQRPTSDSGNLTPALTSVSAFTGIRFYKEINARRSCQWTSAGSSAPYHWEVAYDVARCERDFGEYMDNGSVSGLVTLGGDSSSTSDCSSALTNSVGGKVLGTVTATVLVTVSHVSWKQTYASWRSGSAQYETTDYTATATTYPIRYTLTGATVSGGRIVWVPSMSANDIIDAALTLSNFNRTSSVFPTSDVTNASVPSSGASGLPSLPTPAGTPTSSSETESSEARFYEFLEARFGVLASVGDSSGWNDGMKGNMAIPAHFAFADITPRTADQTANP